MMLLAIRDETKRRITSRDTVSDVTTRKGGVHPFMVVVESIVRVSNTVIVDPRAFSDHKTTIASASGRDNRLQTKQELTIADLGWTQEQAISIRGMFGSILEDWDDPSMDVYDDL